MTRSFPGLLAALLVLAGGLLPLAGCAPGQLFRRTPPPLREFRIPLDGPWRVRPADLAPANLYAADVDDGGWRTLEIPTNWYLAGIDHAGAMWHRRAFRADEALRGRMVRLVFSGVDYAAHVWLNGRFLGSHEGYFEPFEFDVAPHLVYGGENILAVRADSPHEIPGKEWGLRKRLIKGALNHHETRPGGAWSIRGQDRNTGGIWEPVGLRVSEGVAIDDLRVTPEAAPDGSDPRVTVRFTLRSVFKKERPVRLTARLRPHNFAEGPEGPVVLEREATARPGDQEISLEIHPGEVRRWWPWDHGFPHLYRLELEVRRDGRLLDRAEETLGFRTVRRDPESGVWYLNGRRIFLRGTNYISSQWMAEMTRGRLEADIDLMRGANINAVRVHAHVEPRRFYRLCDEAGLLVWQDFPLHRGYTDDARFIREAARQARAMVDLLDSHPSVIAWCAHNEPPFDARWTASGYEEYDPDQNRKLDAVLLETLQKADDTRYIHPYVSAEERAFRGRGSGSRAGDERPARLSLIAEYGAQALPVLETLREIFDPETLWPDTPEEWDRWAYHNFRKHETFDIARVPMGRDIDAFIENTQTHQARLLTHATEAYRRQRYSPVAAVFQFLFNENWPSVGWGIVDHLRRPKPGYEALKTAFQPVLPGIEWNRVRWPEGASVRVVLWAVNDLADGFPGASLEYSLLTAEEGGEILKGSIHLDIAPDSGTSVMPLVMDALGEGLYSLETRLVSGEGEVLGTNRYDFTVAP